MEVLKSILAEVFFGALVGMGLRGFLGSLTHNDGFVLSGVIGAGAFTALVNLGNIKNLLF